MTTTCRVVTLPVRSVSEIMLLLLHDLDTDRTDPSAVRAGDHSCGDYPQVGLVQVHHMPAFGTLVNALPSFGIAFIRWLSCHATPFKFPATLGRHLKSKFRVDHNASQQSEG